MTEERAGRVFFPALSPPPEYKITLRGITLIIRLSFTHTLSKRSGVNCFLRSLNEPFGGCGSTAVTSHEVHFSPLPPRAKWISFLFHRVVVKQKQTSVFSVLIFLILPQQQTRLVYPVFMTVCLAVMGRAVFSSPQLRRSRSSA